MKKEKRYKKQHWRKMKGTSWLVVFGCLVVIGLLGAVLNKHLFIIQRVERLEKYKDYSDFRLKLYKEEECSQDKKTLVFTSSNIRYYTSCLKNVDVLYGSTPTTLKNALEKGYLDLKLLKTDTVEETVKEQTKYTYKSTSEDKDSYVVTVITKEDKSMDVYLEAL